MEKQTTTKQSNQKNYIIFGIIILILGAIVGVATFLYNNQLISSEYFYANTTINGVDVSGMSKYEAANIISTKLLKDREEIDITLTHGEKNWNFKGSDFEINNNVFGIVESTFKYGRNGTFSDKVSMAKKIKNDGFDVDVSYRYVLGNFDEKIDQIISEISTETIEPTLNFRPSETPIFTITNGQVGVNVDKDLLYQKIDEIFKNNLKIKVEIPIIETTPTTKNEDLEKLTKLRAKFSTNLKTSTKARKNNVKLALNSFNGKCVMPNEEVSFNDTTGEKTEKTGYQKANIILNGVYVEGLGGGICQASTTLYNALLLADIPILEVNSHSLPVSYVPLAFDAMVFEGSSDLKFKNNLSCPIYIRTYVDNDSANVEIYSESLEEGIMLKPKVEFVETMPHNGDRIVKDSEGKYENKVTFEGEYLRLKYPQEGYHAKAIMEYYKNGELVGQKLLRDETYQPQEGIIIEGTKKLGEGMTLPENKISIISPQQKNKISEESAINKIQSTNPTSLNP